MQAATEAGLTALVVDCDRARSRSAVASGQGRRFPEFWQQSRCLVRLLVGHGHGSARWSVSVVSPIAHG